MPTPNVKCMSDQKSEEKNNIMSSWPKLEQETCYFLSQSKWIILKYIWRKFKEKLPGLISDFSFFYDKFHFQYIS